MAAALTTGERGAIPERVLVAMRDAGLAHLLAISGLHFSLVAALLFGGMRAGLAAIPAVALRYPIKKWAAAGAFAGALVYLTVSGASIPTQRAFLMLSAVLLAVLLDRAAISMRLVAAAAAVVLAIAPESLLGASFQMSFAAVVALVAVYESIRERLAGLRADAGPSAALRPLRVRCRADDPGCRPRHRAVRRLSLQPARGVRRGGEPVRRADYRALDHALGHPRLPADAARPRRARASAHGMGDSGRDRRRRNRLVLAVGGASRSRLCRLHSSRWSPPAGSGSACGAAGCGRSG